MLHSSEYEGECLGHDLITPFTQIYLFIKGNLIHSMHILYNEHLI